MLCALRSKLSYANVMATVAVFIALGGTAYGLAAGSIGSREIRNNSVRSRDLRNNDIRGTDVRRGTLTGSDLRSNSIGSAQIADHSVRGPDIADSSISGHDLRRETLGDDKLAPIEDTQGVVKLSLGESKTIIDRAPFRLEARCLNSPFSDDPNDLWVRVIPTSSEPGTVANLPAHGGGELDPGDDVAINASGPGSDGGSFLLTAPSGAMLSGYIGVGVHEFAADCWAVALTTGEKTGP